MKTVFLYWNSKYKCTKHQFIHLLTATCNEWHIENSMGHWMLPIAFTTKFGTKLAITLFEWKIFARFLRVYGNFRGWAIKCRQLHLCPIDISCHDNEIWNKIRYNSACVKDSGEIFAPIKGFSKMGHQMLPIAFFPTDLRWNGNEIWNKIGYNSRRVKNFCKIFAFIGGFRLWSIECC